VGEEKTDDTRVALTHGGEADEVGVGFIKQIAGAPLINLFCPERLISRQSVFPPPPVLINVSRSFL
jgi:hypothetical protein